MIKRILKSSSLREALRQAVDIADNPAQLSAMSQQVKAKLGQTQFSRSSMSGFMDRIRTLLRMLWAYRSGEYREVPWRSLIMIIGALLYFLMPVDVIPDFFPGAGYVDDFSVILFVFNSIGGDIEAFRRFEDAQTGAVQESAEKMNA
jgi:uncharacterized membrane protein YkvA (DUF1232 family)